MQYLLEEIEDVANGEDGMGALGKPCSVRKVLGGGGIRPAHQLRQLGVGWQLEQSVLVVGSFGVRELLGTSVLR